MSALLILLIARFREVHGVPYVYSVNQLAALRALDALAHDKAPLPELPAELPNAVMATLPVDEVLA